MNGDIFADMIGSTAEDPGESPIPAHQRYSRWSRSHWGRRNLQTMLRTHPPSLAKQLRPHPDSPGGVQARSTLRMVSQISS